MANRRLGTAVAVLKLPTKKVKAEKKPKWQVKTGKKTKEPVIETPEVADPSVVADEAPTLPPEPTDTPVLPTTPETTSVEPAPTDEAATTHDVPTETITDKPTTKNPRKLKVKADAPQKKLSMIAAALQVLLNRNVPMTCPELIDVMATEGLWVSSGGKTLANTLYAAISRDIKDKGTSSSFRKAERGRFEGK